MSSIFIVQSMGHERKTFENTANSLPFVLKNWLIVTSSNSSASSGTWPGSVCDFLAMILFLARVLVTCHVVVAAGDGTDCSCYLLKIWALRLETLALQKSSFQLRLPLWDKSSLHFLPEKPRFFSGKCLICMYFPPSYSHCCTAKPYGPLSVICDLLFEIHHTSFGQFRFQPYSGSCIGTPACKLGCLIQNTTLVEQGRDGLLCGSSMI